MYSFYRSLCVRTLTLTCVLSLVLSTSPLAYGWAAGNPEAGPDANNGSTGTAQGGNGPAGPGPGQGGGEGGAPSGSGSGSNSTGSSGSGTGGGYSSGYGAGDYSYDSSVGGSSPGGSGNTGNNPGNPNASGYFGGGAGSGGFGVGQTGFEGSPEAQRSSVTESFDSWAFTGNESNVSIETSQSALDAVSSALSVLSDAIADEFSLAAEAAEQNTQVTTVTPSVHVTTDVETYEAYQEAVAPINARENAAWDAYDAALANNDQTAAQAARAEAQAAWEASVSLRSSMFGTDAPNIALAGSGAGGAPGAGPSDAPSAVTGGAGTGQAGAGNIGSLAGNFSNMGGGNPGIGSGAGSLGGHVSGRGNNGDANTTGNSGSAGTGGTQSLPSSYYFGNTEPGTSDGFSGSVNSGNATVELQNVINLGAEAGSASTAEYNGQQVTVTGPTAAITGLSGAVEYTERDMSTLGLTFAGELPSAIVAKIQRGETLTNDDVRQIAVIANIAVTRALADAGVSYGPFDGSVADALEAPSQFSALNPDKIGATRQAYNQNPDAFDEIARQFLDGTIARERGYDVAAPVPRANAYWNPDAVDNPRTPQIEREPWWGDAVTDRESLGTRPHSHTAGTLRGEYQTRGQLEGLDVLNINAFEAVMNIDERGLVPTDQAALDAAGARFAFNSGGELSGFGIRSNQTGVTSFVPIDASAFSATFAQNNPIAAGSLGGVGFDRSVPALPENAFTVQNDIFDLTSPFDYVDTAGGRVTAGSFQLGATGLAEAQQHAQLTETYENATHRTEAPDTTVNGLSLGQVAQVEVANLNQRNGTNYGVNVYSAKGPHGSARHRDHDDTSRGINGCACAIDFSITDENGRALPVDGNEDVYTEVARGLVGRTGGSIGLGAEYMSHGMHFDMANVINPDTNAFAEAGRQEWGSLGNAMDDEFAALRENAPEATVERNDETNEVSVTLPTEDTPFDLSSIPGIANDIYGIDPNESQFVDPEEFDTYIEEQQRETEPATEEEQITGIRERAAEQVRSFIQFVTDLLKGDGDTSPVPNDRDGATTTAPVSSGYDSDWWSFVSFTSVAHAQTETDVEGSRTLTGHLTAFWNWLFGSTVAPRRIFSDLPGAQLHAYSRPYVPVLVQVDELTGAVKFTRGEIKNMTDANELPNALEIAFESEDDSSSLVVNRFGDVVYSNGMFAPETDAEGNVLSSDADYVYFVEYWRDGQIVRSETNTGALPGNFFTRVLGDLFSNDDPFLLTDVDTITYVYGDPEPEVTHDDYREYTITLTDGTTRHVTLPANSSLSFYKSELENIGYNGDIMALLNIATETERKQGADAKGFIARSLDRLIGSGGEGDTLPDQQQEVFSDLTSALNSNEYGFSASKVTGVVVHFNVPVICTDDTTTGYIYEVTLSGQQPNGALTSLSAAAARCGNGGPRTYASEIATHIESATGLTVSDEQILELIEFQYNTPEYIYLDEEGDLSTSAPEIPNTTNEITLEAKVTRDGVTIGDWSSGAVSLADGDQLHLRWNAGAYQRCLPFIADNGAYSLSRSDLRLVSGNTESEGYDLIERTGTYRLECDGQSNGEDGVDERRIEVQVN